VAAAAVRWVGLSGRVGDVDEQGDEHIVDQQGRAAVEQEQGGEPGLGIGFVDATGDNEHLQRDKIDSQ
jgi:hypothetical protein